jgi:hypothetical protein
MTRTTLGVVAGLAAWVTIVMVAGTIMRGAWAEYARVAEAMTFTLPMMFARLAIGALATLTTGWVAVVIARRSMLASLMPGVLLLVVFIPQHVMLWDRFPVWYHLTFLGSIIPLVYLGGKVAEPGHGTRAREQAATRGMSRGRTPPRRRQAAASASDPLAARAKRST